VIGILGISICTFVMFARSTIGNVAVSLDKGAARKTSWELKNPREFLLLIATILEIRVDHLDPAIELNSPPD
jgi:hypothetical protein